MQLFECLEQIWKSNTLKRHAVLIGEGGSGKTTQLKKLWYDLLHNSAQNAPIPIYVPLYGFNGSDTYIQDYILQEYCGHSKSSDTDQTRKNDLLLLFKQTDDSPRRFVLLLDGINEAQNWNEIITEINDYLSNCKNLQIVISSRYKLNDFNNFTQLQVKPLTVDFVKNKLKEKNEYKDYQFSDKLLSLLTNPMYLSMFLGLGLDIPEIETKNITSAGEIFKANNDRFIALSKLNRSEESLLYKTSTYGLMEMLPFCSYNIGKIVFSKAEFESAIKNGHDHLKSKHGNVYSNVISSFTAELLTKENISSNSSSDELLLALLNAFEKNGNVSELYIEIFKIKHIIEQVSEEQYKFSHENYLQFYAALYYYNEMTVCPDNQAPACLTDSLIDENLLSWIGELFGEHNFMHKTTLQEEISPLESWLHSHCEIGKFECNSEKLACATHNVVEIMKVTRKNNLTADYSCLDLTLCDFYGCSLPNSNFKNAKINKSCFVSEGPQQISQLLLSPTGDKMVCNDRYNNIFIYNTFDRKPFAKLNLDIYSHPFRFKSHNTIIVATNRELYSLNIKNKYVEKTILPFAWGSIPAMNGRWEISSDARTLVMAKYDTHTSDSLPLQLSLFQDETFGQFLISKNENADNNLHYFHFNCFKKNIHSFLFNRKGVLSIVSSSHGRVNKKDFTNNFSIELWNTNCEKPYRFSLIHEILAENVIVSFPYENEDYIVISIVINQKSEIYIFEIDSLKELPSLNHATHKCRIITPGSLCNLKISLNSDKITGIFEDGNIKSWDFFGNPLNNSLSLNNFNSTFCSYDISYSGDIVAYTERDGEIRTKNALEKVIKFDSYNSEISRPKILLNNQSMLISYFNKQNYVIKQLNGFRITNTVVLKNRFPMPFTLQNTKSNFGVAVSDKGLVQISTADLKLWDNSQYPPEENSLCFSNSDKFIITLSSNGLLSLYDSNELNEPLKTQYLNKNFLDSTFVKPIIKFEVNDKFAIMGFEEWHFDKQLTQNISFCRLIKCDLQSYKITEFQLVDNSNKAILDFVINDSNKIVISTGDYASFSIKEINLQNGKITNLTTPNQCSKYVKLLVFSEKFKCFAAADFKTVAVYKIGETNPIIKQTYKSIIRALKFLPNKQILYIFLSNGMIDIYNVFEKKQLYQIKLISSLNIDNCDFRNTDMSDELKELLEMNGGIVN